MFIVVQRTVIARVQRTATAIFFFAYYTLPDADAFRYGATPSLDYFLLIDFSLLRYAAFHFTDTPLLRRMSRHYAFLPRFEFRDMIQRFSPYIA